MISRIVISRAAIWRATSQRPARQRSAGFTLIEILLALAILGFISTILWGTFSQTNYIKKRAEATQDRTHSARVALMRMTREIEMAFRSDSENPSLQEQRTMFTGIAHPESDELTFSWFGRQRMRADMPDSDSGVVMYYAEPDPDDRMVVNLMRRETRRLEPADPHTLRGEAYVLCPGIASLKFQYYDFKTKEWREQWSTMGADGMQYLPTHVRITLTIYDERGRPEVFTSSARVMMTERVAYRPVKS